MSHVTRGALAPAIACRRRLGLLGACAIAAMAVGSRPAAAETWTVGDAQISFETTLSAGVGIRTSSPNPYFLDPAHGGTYAGTMGPSDLNWPEGKAFQAPLTGTNDLQIDLDNYTTFWRATYLIDPINANPNSPSYEPLTHQAVFTTGQSFHLLDGWVRGNYTAFDQKEAVTLGWQTYNWGESLFIRNGLNAVNPINVAGIHAAGADIRSLYYPLPSISLRTSLPDGFSLDAFYEFVWVKSQLDPFGTFFSTDVIVTPGATQIALPPAISALGLGYDIPRVDDRKASDGGQFGFALHKSIEALDDGDLSLYAENYGARFPVASFMTGDKTIPKGQNYADTASYRAEYPNDIQYYGASLSLGGPWGSALQGEVSVSPNTPLQLNPLGLIAGVLAPSLHERLALFCKFGIKLACTKDADLLNTSYIAQAGLPGYSDVIDGYKRFSLTHIRVSDIKSFSGIGGTPVKSWSLAAEYGMEIVNNFPDQATTPFYEQLSVNPLTPGDAAFYGRALNNQGAATQISQGVVGKATFNMPDLIAGIIDVNPSLALEYDFQGTTPAPLVTFNENLLTMTVGINFSYLQKWQANIVYTSHYGLGGSAESVVGLDRDYVAISGSYRF